MRIETDVKLDFKDVLIRPKRSTLNSRNEVDINRAFRFYHTGSRMEGLSADRGQHGRDGHDGRWPRRSAATARMTALHKHYPGRRARRVLLRATRARTRSIRSASPRAISRSSRRCKKRAPMRLSLPRRRQRLFRKIPRHGQARARREPEVRHHGRQCRHRRHDGGADSRRRGHRQDRHRAGLGLHDAPRHRRRLSRSSRRSSNAPTPRMG